MQEVDELILISIKMLFPGGASHMDGEEASVLYIVSGVLENGLVDAILGSKIIGFINHFSGVCLVEVDHE